MLYFRVEDSLTLSHNIGGREIYYQQHVRRERPGLPSPVDAMGRAYTKIRTQLEKDHNVLIF